MWCATIKSYVWLDLSSGFYFLFDMLTVSYKLCSSVDFKPIIQYHTELHLYLQPTSSWYYYIN